MIIARARIQTCVCALGVCDIIIVCAGICVAFWFGTIFSLALCICLSFSGENRIVGLVGQEGTTEHANRRRFLHVLRLMFVCACVCVLCEG